MPFQSEKQRRYLWANEPEIARDWSDTYGHRAQGYDGGVMRVPFYAGEIVPNISTQSLGNQLAFRTNTLLDNRIKTMQNMLRHYDKLMGNIFLINGRSYQ